MNPLKILVVDDEEALVRFTRKIYDKKGFTTFGATDGVAAVEIFKKEHPDIALIDIHMPYSPIDGVEVLRQIKEIDKDAVCIMTTRITDKDKVEASRKLGALHYLLKPFVIEDLDKAINDAQSLLKDKYK